MQKKRSTRRRAGRRANRKSYGSASIANTNCPQMFAFVATAESQRAFGQLTIKQGKIKMNEEANEQNNEAQEWLEPSHVGSEYMRHSQAMEPASRVPVCKAFGIAPGYNVGMLRKMAENYKPKRIVVIDHGENGFEVRRLANNDDVSLFYASLDAKSVDDLPTEESEKKAKTLDAIKSFLLAADEQISTYDPKGVEARGVGCVTWTYLSRKLSAVSAFRKDARGSAEALKEVIAMLEVDGILRKLDKAEASELFNTTAAVYRINKGAL